MNNYPERRAKNGISEIFSSLLKDINEEKAGEINPLINAQDEKQGFSSKPFGHWLIENLGDDTLSLLINDSYSWSQLVVAINKKKWKSATLISKMLKPTEKRNFCEYYLHNRGSKDPIKKEYLQMIARGEFLTFNEMKDWGVAGRNEDNSIRSFSTKTLNIRNNKEREQIQEIINNVNYNNFYHDEYFLLALGIKADKISKLAGTRSYLLGLRYAFSYNQPEAFDGYLSKSLKYLSKQETKEKFILQLIEDHLFRASDNEPFYFFSYDGKRTKNKRKYKIVEEEKYNLFKKLIKALNIEEIHLNNKQIDEFYVEYQEDLYREANKTIKLFNSLIKFTPMSAKDFFDERDEDKDIYHLKNIVNVNLGISDWQHLSVSLDNKGNRDIEQMLMRSIVDNPENVFYPIKDKVEYKKAEDILNKYIRGYVAAKDDTRKLDALLIEFQTKSTQQRKFKI